MKLDIVKLLKENISTPHYNINCNKILIDSPPRVMKIKINKYDLMKLKSFNEQKILIEDPHFPKEGIYLV